MGKGEDGVRVMNGFDDSRDNSAFHIAGFQPLTLSDFPGRTAAIVFTQGCNFVCPFCHNRELISVPPSVRCEKYEVSKVATENLHRVMELLKGRRGMLDGVVLSGGEPTLQPGIREFAGEVKELGIAIKLDTNGSRPDVIAALLRDSLLDFIAVDIKGPWSRYEECCGRSGMVSEVKKSVELVASSGVPYYFRTTFFSSLLSEKDLECIRRQLPKGANYLVQKGHER